MEGDANAAATSHCPTRKVDGRKARLLHRVVRGEFEAQDVALRGQDGRQVSAAEEAVLPQLVLAQLAPHLDVVVFAILLQ